MKRFGIIYFTLLFSLFAANTRADSVTEVLDYKHPPAGVIFEIVSDDEDYLWQVLPTVQQDIDRLRARFPKLAIAIVSHGMEQLALTYENREDYAEIQDQVQRLVHEKHITFHVCGTYARMHGVDEDEFPEYIDVAPYGPAQVKSYIEFGYVKILVD